MSAWLAAASSPKCGERCAERGALIEPRSIAVSPVRPSGQRSSSTAPWIAPAMSSGSGAAATGASAGAASGEQTSHMPQSSASVSPKCSATCRCRQVRDSAKRTSRSARASASCS